MPLTDEKLREQWRVAAAKRRLPHPEREKEKLRRFYALRRAKRSSASLWIRRFEKSLSQAYCKKAEIIDQASLKVFYEQIFTKSTAVCDYCRGEFGIMDITIDHKHPYCL